MGAATRSRKLTRRRLLAIGFVAAIAWFVIPRTIATIRFANQAHVPSLPGEFEGFADLLPPAGSEISKFHLGLPHNFAEPSEFIRAVWLTRTKAIKGYRFASSRWEPSRAFRQTASRFLAASSSYRSYRGPKLCGGYHADFLARYTTGRGNYTFMICFGCHKILAFTPTGDRIVEISDTAFDELKEAWRTERSKP